MITRLGALALILMTTACQREERKLQPDPASRATHAAMPQGDLQPGGVLPASGQVKSPYEGNAFAISEGQRWFGWYNCSGCHANGGGGMGLPLLSPKFVYGREPAQIYDTIVRGRPNGMPTWGGRIPEYQIWQIVAYVRSLSGGEPLNATPQRSDAIQPKSGAQLK